MLIVQQNAEEEEEANNLVEEMVPVVYEIETATADL